MPDRRGSGEGFVAPACARWEVHVAPGAQVTDRRPDVGNEPSRNADCVGGGIAVPVEIRGGSTASRIPVPVRGREREREATLEAEAGIRLPSGASAPAAGRSPGSEPGCPRDRQHSTQMGKNDAMAHDCR